MIVKRITSLVHQSLIAKRITFLVRMMQQAIHEFLDDNCIHLSAAISYYLILSLFPLILAALSILSHFSEPADAQAKVIEVIRDVLPFSKELVTDIMRDLAPTWKTASAIGIIGLIWAGTGIFNAIRKSLNTAWGIKQSRPFLRERLIEFAMMLGLVVFLIVYVGMTAGFNYFEGTEFFKKHLADASLLWESLVILASIVIAFVGFLLLYRFIPNTRVPWKNVWIGALIGAVLFEIVKNFFVWMVGQSASYSLVYGTLSAFIAVMVWAYTSAMILLFCAKLISIYPRMKSSLLEETHVETENAAKSDSEPPVSKFLFGSKPSTKKKN